MAPIFLTLRKTLRVKVPEINYKRVEADVIAKIDGIIEYPGSRKGNPGIWRLPDWLMFQVDKRMEGVKGKERV